MVSETVLKVIDDMKVELAEHHKELGKAEYVAYELLVSIKSIKKGDGVDSVVCVSEINRLVKLADELHTCIRRA